MVEQRYCRIGSLRDIRLAQEIKTQLDKKGFTTIITPASQSEDIWLEISPPEREVEAKIIYARYLGLLPKYDFEMAPSRPIFNKMGPVTKFLFYGAILTFFAQLYFQYQIGQLLFEDFFLYGSPKEGTLFSAILKGELWRLFTPIFLHFGLLHILFNSLALRDFGSALETSEGSKNLLLFTLAAALISNFSQYLLTGPMFGGMSGVVYAYLGHFLGQQIMRRKTVMKIPRQGIISLIIWFFATFLPGPIQLMANGAHLSGMAFGLIWGIGGVKNTDKKRWALSTIGVLFGASILLLLEIYRLDWNLYFMAKTIAFYPPR